MGRCVPGRHRCLDSIWTDRCKLARAGPLSHSPEFFHCRKAICKTLTDKDGFSTPTLSCKEVPDTATTCAGVEPQLAVSHLPLQKIQHLVRIVAYQPFCLGH